MVTPRGASAPAGTSAISCWGQGKSPGPATVIAGYSLSAPFPKGTPGSSIPGVTSSKKQVPAQSGKARFLPTARFV